MKAKSFLMILILLILPLMGLAQSPYGNDVVEVCIEKKGQLESKLKKANALNAKKLSIISSGNYSSELNVKDLKFLSGMNQLEELYIDVDTQDGYEFELKHGKLTVANFPNLKKFGFGTNTSYRIGVLFDLKVQGYVCNGVILPNISFEDIYIISKLGHRSSVELLDRNYKIHSIHVNSRDWLNSEVCNEVCKSLNPAVIYIHTGEGVEKYLANYNSLLYEDDKDLTQYDGILSAALTNTNFDSIKLPDKQTSIGDRFFDNVTAQSVDLNNIKTIGKNAFYGSHIKEIHMPSTIQDIDEKAFNNSEITTINMAGEYPPALYTVYTDYLNSNKCFGIENIQFIIPKGSRDNYDIGQWKKLRVLEDGATTSYAFDVKEPGTLSSLLTDDIKKTVVSLKLRGVLYSEDIKLLENCPNLKTLDLAETFITQSPTELKEQQETSDYLAGIFMSMGIIAQSEFEMGRMSTVDNMQAQFLAKLGEMAKNEKIQSNPNCMAPDVSNIRIEELILPLQLQTVGDYVFPKSLKNIILPPDLKRFYISKWESNITEITLPASVQDIILKSNKRYGALQYLDFSACINPTVYLNVKCDNLRTLKLPKSYESKECDGTYSSEVSTSTPIEIYFNGRELKNRFTLWAPKDSKIFIPKGSRAGYSSLINDGYEVIEQ